MSRPQSLASVLVPLLGSCVASPRNPPWARDASSVQASEVLAVEVIPLQHAQAEKLAATLTELLDAIAQAASLRLQEQGGCALMKPDAVVPTPRPTVRIVPDPGTNSVLVQAPEEEMPRILELIERLDSEQK